MFDKIKNFFNNIIHDKRKLFIFIGVVIVVILVLFFLIDHDNVFISVIKNPDGIDFHNEYEGLNGKENAEGFIYPEVNIPANNKFEYSTSKEIINIFNKKKSAVIYFGYASCVYCRSAIQVLYDVSEDTEIDKIYYLDVSKKDDDYNEIVNMLDYKFLNVKDGQDDELYAPLVLFVVDGKVVSYKKDTVYSHTDPFNELDESQIAGLSEIYRYGIRDVIDSMNNKKNSGDKVS